MTQKGNDVSLRLVLDFIGPFVVHVKGDTAKIHAPLCADHHANVLTDSDDIALPGCLLIPKPAGGYKEGFVYRLNGPKGADKCNCMSPEQLLIVNKAISDISPEQCHLVLEVPTPNTVVPLLPDQIWMHNNKAVIWVNADPPGSEIVKSKRARGLRFVYSDCPATPDIRLTKQPQASPYGLGEAPNPPHSEALGLDPPHYHITLRFASSGTSPDEHHEDAYNCFQEMRTLIPDSRTWRVDFDDTNLQKQGNSFERKGGPMPVDCGAAILFAQE